MKIKADVYFNNGMFEAARFGKHVVMKNTMTPEQHRQYINDLKMNYNTIKNDIDRRVSAIRDEVTRCNPLSLLSFSSDMFLMSSLGIHSEVQLSHENITIGRMTEYIQSILVSSPNNFVNSDNQSDPTQEFSIIQDDIIQLYRLIDQFYLSWGASLNDLHPDWNDELIITVVEAQRLYNVRGHRYQVFEDEYYEKLLSIHNDTFQTLFNLSYKDILEGIKKLQYALSQGKFEAINKMERLFKEYEKGQWNILDEFNEAHQKEGIEICDELLGLKLRKVISVTGWSDKFVKEFSYGLDEELDFFQEPEFAGWPVVALPIKKRPFIEIDNEYYCFDYYTFIDNFYRSIQKTINRLDPVYQWNKRQNEASEKMVESIFQKILPCSKTYHGNYYPFNGSVKQLAENDLLVLYFDTLIIVEVKAGSFTYTPPLSDYKSHISSYKTLIEKADWQCKRTYDYLVSEDYPEIYDYKGNIKEKINMSAISDIFMISVTVDNINDFAARAEKLNFLKLQCDAISISVDDLMVYREFFDTPLVFMHFLKQRRLATQKEKIALNDELDHLGLYLEYNCYPFQADYAAKDALLQFYGYRESLDKYFCSLYHPQLNPTKPLPYIPDLFIQILKYLEKEKIRNKVEISSYLLDFASDAKDKLCEQVKYTLNRQLQIKDACIISTSGTGDSLRYTCYVNQNGVPLLSYNEKREYILSSLLWNQEQERVLLDLYFDGNNGFNQIVFKRFTKEDILESEKEKLKKQGQQRAKLRLDKYKSTYGNKIGRNQLCPCGSGKKYKKCCSR